MKIFSFRSQTKWGITYPSPMNWQAAVFELSGIERNSTPSTRLGALVRCSMAIYNEFNMVVKPIIIQQMKDKLLLEKKPINNLPDPVLGADDLVPIFLYVICQCCFELKHPISNRDILWATCIPDQLHGESGYYLTLYESAIEYIIHENMTPDEGIIEFILLSHYFRDFSE